MCHLLCILRCWEVNKKSCDKGGVYNLLEPDVIDMGCKESMQSCLYFSPQLIPSPSSHLSTYLELSLSQLSKAIPSRGHFSLLSPPYTPALSSRVALSYM